VPRERVEKVSNSESLLQRECDLGDCRLLVILPGMSIRWISRDLPAIGLVDREPSAGLTHLQAAKDPLH